MVSSTQSLNQQKVDNLKLPEITNKRQSGKIITVSGQVVKLLADDNDGSKHQKLILQVGKQTLLVAHNIDVAARIPVKENDRIWVHGEYEWNEKGGLIHWTHVDTNNKHENGWIKHNNKIYQ